MGRSTLLFFLVSITLRMLHTRYRRNVFKKGTSKQVITRLKTVNDQHLSMGRNLGVYYYITSNHKDKKLQNVGAKK